MKTVFYTILVFVTLTPYTYCQELTQTVRGMLTDNDSKLPLTGAEVIILGTDPLIGTVTDANGNFRLEEITIGRITLQVSYLGYETRILPNIIVNTGKEVVLDLDMQQSAVRMDEVVKASKKKGEALNGMALLSSRSISVEVTKRYAGGFNDPSRIVTNFAGATNTGDGSSDIIVRGNSPKYMQWRLDGIEISSPYHFDDQNTSFGALTVLNNNLLLASDFYAGAFSPEYGNVLSNVYDVRIRPGNNEKLECAMGIGLIGTDITVEGPLKKGYKGSFLTNYRYSTAALITEIGLIPREGIFKFQDANLKILLPTKSIGTFSIIGIAGLSNFYIDELTSDLFTTTTRNSAVQNSITKTYDKSNYLLNTGMNHIMTINRNSYLKTSLFYSGSGILDEIFESQIIQTINPDESVSDSLYNTRLNFENNINKSVYRGAITYNNKINAKHKVQMGLKYNLFNYDFEQNHLSNENSMFTLVDFNEYISTFQSFISWKYRVNEKVTFVSGLHNLNVLLNNKSTFEPRIAFQWRLNNKNSIHAGYGNHSTMESIHHYFAKVKMEDGSIIEPNKDLGLLSAHHWVLGYERRFTEKFMAKAELYYQGLYNLPVENNDTSYFATINEGLDYQYVDLVNEGTGRNYGLEITMERFFDGNYYFMFNTSLFSSTYKSLEGIERNTRYNQNFLANVLFGKEFTQLGKKKNQTLALNLHMFFQGGQRYIPLLRDDQGNLAVDTENNQYWDYSKAFDNYLDHIYQINISASYKFNRIKTTHEIFLDLQNLTNNTNRIYEYYNESEPNSIGYLRQFGFFPNLMYRVYF